MNHSTGGLKSEHYPSIELCKKLTKTGFPRTTMFTQQSSYFMENWYLVMNTKIRNEIFNPKCFENWSTTADMKKEIVYPSVMELLDELPHKINSSSFLITYDDVEATVSYKNIYFTQGTLPNALAEMWLWLHDNGYLPVVLENN